MAKEASECSECGCPVLDRAKHRRWHRNVVTVRDETMRRRSSSRFIGEDIEDEQLADGHVAEDEPTPAGGSL